MKDFTEVELRLLAHRHVLTELVASISPRPSFEHLSTAIDETAKGRPFDPDAERRIALYRDELDEIVGTAEAERRFRGQK